MPPTNRWKRLGEKLALPPFLEPRRAEIEAGLKPRRAEIEAGLKPLG